MREGAWDGDRWKINVSSSVSYQIDVIFNAFLPSHSTKTSPPPTVCSFDVVFHFSGHFSVDSDWETIRLNRVETNWSIDIITEPQSGHNKRRTLTNWKRITHRVVTVVVRGAFEIPQNNLCPNQMTAEERWGDMRVERLNKRLWPFFSAPYQLRMKPSREIYF